jgi:hypothetical protein
MSVNKKVTVPEGSDRIELMMMLQKGSREDLGRGAPDSARTATSETPTAI